MSGWEITGNHLSHFTLLTDRFGRDGALPMPSQEVFSYSMGCYPHQFAPSSHLIRTEVLPFHQLVCLMNDQNLPIPLAILTGLSDLETRLFGIYLQENHIFVRITTDGQLAFPTNRCGGAPPGKTPCCWVITHPASHTSLSAHPNLKVLVSVTCKPSCFGGNCRSLTTSIVIPIIMSDI